MCTSMYDDLARTTWDAWKAMPWEECTTIPDIQSQHFVGRSNHCIIWPDHIVGTKILHYMPGIDRIIFNNPATIVYWDDGTKTVVKTHDEEFSEEHGLAMAFARKVLETSYGNKNPRAGFKRLVREAKRY